MGFSTTPFRGGSKKLKIIYNFPCGVLKGYWAMRKRSWRPLLIECALRWHYQAQSWDPVNCALVTIRKLFLTRVTILNRCICVFYLQLDFPLSTCPSQDSSRKIELKQKVVVLLGGGIRGWIRAAGNVGKVYQKRRGFSRWPPMSVHTSPFYQNPEMCVCRYSTPGIQLKAIARGLKSWADLAPAIFCLGEGLDKTLNLSIGSPSQSMLQE